MIEHVSTGEQKNSNKADGSPEVPVLQDGCDIRSGDRNERDEAENTGSDGNRLHPIKGSVDCRLRNISGELS